MKKIKFTFTHGSSEFQGEWIQYGSQQFLDWDAVEEYLNRCNSN